MEIQKTLAVAAILVAIGVSGCATMSAEECQTANWQAIGHEDGSQGLESTQFAKHRKACAEHGVQANFAQYKQGYEGGVRLYCTPERGYSLGKDNNPLPTICPNDLAPNVDRGYRLGQELYVKKKALKDQIEAVNRNMEHINADIKRLDGELAEHKRYLQIAEDGLKNPNISKSEQLTFYTQRDQVKHLIRRKQREIDDINFRKMPYTREIEALQLKIRRLNDRPMPPLR